MRHRKQRRFAFIVPAVLLGIAGLVAATGLGFRSQPSGIREGAMVAAEFPPSSPAAYAWMSDGDALLFQPIFFRNAVGLIPIKVRPGTGVVARYAPLGVPDPMLGWPFVAASPNDERLLTMDWWQRGSPSRLRHFALRPWELHRPVAPDWGKAASLSGGDYPLWEPGGAGLVQLAATAAGWEVRRHSISNTSRPVSSRPIPGGSGTPKLLGFAPNGDAIISCPRHQVGAGKSVRMSVRMLKVPALRNGAIAEAVCSGPDDGFAFGPEALSPDGRRVLWRDCTFGHRLHRLRYRLRRWSPRLAALLPPVQPGPIYSRYWVSGADGTKLQLVAVDRYFPPSSLRWTPDSRHISFVEDKRLYVRLVP